MSLLIAVTVLITVSCSPMPRYTKGGSKTPIVLSSKSKKKSNTKSRRIPVVSNPKLSYQQSWKGTASWYGKKFHGKLTANGEIYDMYSLTAAHKTLPLGTVVKVTNIANRKSVKVRVNDRGPYIEGRMIDLSYAAAKKLGYDNLGTAEVRLQVIKFGDNSYKKK